MQEKFALNEPENDIVLKYSHVLKSPKLFPFRFRTMNYFADIILYIGGAVFERRHIQNCQSLFGRLSYSKHRVAPTGVMNRIPNLKLHFLSVSLGAKESCYFRLYATARPRAHPLYSAPS